MQNKAATCEHWQFLEQLNANLPDTPTISLPEIHSREVKSYVHTMSCMWMFKAPPLTTYYRVIRRFTWDNILHEIIYRKPLYTWAPYPFLHLRLFNKDNSNSSHDDFHLLSAYEMLNTLQSLSLNPYSRYTRILILWIYYVIASFKFLLESHLLSETWPPFYLIFLSVFTLSRCYCYVFKFTTFSPSIICYSFHPSVF